MGQLFYRLQRRRRKSALKVEPTKAYSVADHFVLPDGGRERNDCSVRAVAIALGKPYPEVHAAFKANGREDRHGTFTCITRAVLCQSGANVVELSLPLHTYSPVDNGWQVKYRRTGGWTVASFVRSHKRGRYIVRVNGHMFAVLDGVVYDHAGGSRRQVLEVWEVK